MKNLAHALFDDHLVTVPTLQTVEKVRAYLSSAPFDSEPSDNWHVTILVANQPIPKEALRQGCMYSAIPTTADIWHDDNLGRSNLVITLNSPELQARHGELEAAYGSRIDSYVPHLTLVYGFPPLSQANKAFLNSFKESMYRIGKTEEPFIFQGELLVDSHGYVPNVEGQKYFSGRN